MKWAVGLGLGVLLASGCANPQPSDPGTSATAPAAKQWVMPNVVGSNLQAAQNEIQKLTGNPLFLTLSHDATGQGRLQVADANWKVCAQNIAPGTPFTKDTTIDFSAVKLAENCPG